MADAGAGAAAGVVLTFVLEYLRCFSTSVDSQTPGGLGTYLAVAGSGPSGSCMIVFCVFFLRDARGSTQLSCGVCVAVVSVCPCCGEMCSCRLLCV